VLSEAQLVGIEAALASLGGADALWVFGSEATGRATASSDVDLAALFAARPSIGALIAARAELEDILKRPVDLVDLETASPILAMQVLRHGRLVRERDVAHRVRFTAALPGRYEDVILLRRPAERLLLARLSRGRA
jgi:predicted nucleotidyltransferase